jgi:hypothetical protein
VDHFELIINKYPSIALFLPKKLSSRKAAETTKKNDETRGKNLSPRNRKV